MTAVSQTAGPETVLAGEAELPFALVGYATDYANGVQAEATPVERLLELIAASTDTFARLLAGGAAARSTATRSRRRASCTASTTRDRRGRARRGPRARTGLAGLAPLLGAAARGRGSRCC